MSPPTSAATDTINKELLTELERNGKEHGFSFFFFLQPVFTMFWDGWMMIRERLWEINCSRFCPYFSSFRVVLLTSGTKWGVLIVIYLSVCLSVSASVSTIILKRINLFEFCFRRSTSNFKIEKEFVKWPCRSKGHSDEAKVKYVEFFVLTILDLVWGEGISEIGQISTYGDTINWDTIWWYYNIIGHEMTNDAPRFR